MYNRRKIDRISEDIYIIGHSIVNERKDKRLCKVLKSIGLVSNSSQGGNHDQSINSIAEPVDLMETCLLLRDTVVNLTGAVSTLKEEITVLREKVTLLEARLDNKRHETRRTNQQAPMNKTSENVDTPQPHVPQERLVDVKNTPNNIDKNDAASLIKSTPTQPTTPQAELENEFRLSSRERRKIRSGSKVKASNRAEIKGSAATGFKISGASEDVQRGSRNIYVGKVKAATSTKDMRDHLRDIGVSHVSDILELSCKVIGQTSFCITVDTAVDEDLIFKPNSWPSGIRIRPYKERSNNKTQQNHDRLDTSKSYPRNNYRQEKAYYAPHIDLHNLRETHNNLSEIHIVGKTDPRDFADIMITMLRSDMMVTDLPMVTDTLVITTIHPDMITTDHTSIIN